MDLRTVSGELAAGQRGHPRPADGLSKPFIKLRAGMARNEFASRSDSSRSRPAPRQSSGRPALGASASWCTHLARDRAIGRCGDGRTDSIGKVICNRRFSILPSVRDLGLLSQALPSLQISQLGKS